MAELPDTLPEELRLGSEVDVSYDYLLHFGYCATTEQMETIAQTLPKSTIREPAFRIIKYLTDNPESGFPREKDVPFNLTVTPEVDREPDVIFSLYSNDRMGKGIYSYTEDEFNQACRAMETLFAPVTGQTRPMWFYDRTHG